MQARTRWTPPGGVLGQLCHQAAQRAASLQNRLRDLRTAALDVGEVPSLSDVLVRGTKVHVVAEIKRRSPSKGVIDESLDAAVRACEYVAGGASALSVLTEPDAFGGSNDDLRAAREAITVPVLKKDFHLHPVQVWEARALGASALLLIVKALGPDEMTRLSDTAGEAGIEAVFEVRDEWELEWALDAGAELVGVNRRDLETLAMHDEVPASLLPRVPASVVAIAESGIAAREDVEAAAERGADAVLVGSSLSRAETAEAAVSALCDVPRRRRSG